MSPCNCGGSGQWQPPAEGGQQQQQQQEAVVAASGPAAPGYFSEPAPKVWNGPPPAASKPAA